MSRRFPLETRTYFSYVTTNWFKVVDFFCVVVHCVISWILRVPKWGGLGGSPKHWQHVTGALCPYLRYLIIFAGRNGWIRSLRCIFVGLPCRTRTNGTSGFRTVNLIRTNEYITQFFYRRAQKLSRKLQTKNSDKGNHTPINRTGVHPPEHKK